MAARVLLPMMPSAGPGPYQNKATVYTILFKAAAETLITIAADFMPGHADVLVLGGLLGVQAHLLADLGK